MNFKGKLADRHISILERLADGPVKGAWPKKGQGVLASYLIRQGFAEYYDANGSVREYYGTSRPVVGTRITPAGRAALTKAKGEQNDG